MPSRACEPLGTSPTTAGVGLGGSHQIGEDVLTNWAGNVTFHASSVHHPRTLSELRTVVTGAERLRVLGTGHSFNRLADSPGSLVRLDAMPHVLGLDGSGVRVGGGLRYTDLGPYLHERGLALANLASLPHISVAGACATGTHGSGVANKSLAAAVSSLEIMTASGDLVTLDRGSADFDGAVVGLGALGVVVSLTLDVVPSFAVRQYVLEGLETSCFDQVLDAAYSVSVFTDWRGAGQVWLKLAPGDAVPPSGWYGTRPADGQRHPVPGMPGDSCTVQGGVPGPWFERLPHFRPDVTPSAGDELQSEFLLPRACAADAIRAIATLGEVVSPVLHVSEIRTVAADDLWLSPSFGRDSLALHFTWIKDAARVMPVIAQVERALAPFDPRPHWGKVYTVNPTGLERFWELARRYDPAGVFRPILPQE
ncbi:FAD-binding protein [Nonomuraea sp. NPDC050556]|uniref:FAD-binding protein n=1 Tax=Nonomuraea sp. NPDC050556 TaxID=3364369 RepID=UPI0037969608